MTEEELKRLIQDNNFGMMGLDKSQIPLPVAGGGLMNLGRGAARVAGPWIRRNIVNPIKEIPVPARIAAGTGAAGAGALLMDQEPPMAQAEDVVVPGTGESGVSKLPVGQPPVDPWTVPPGMQTGVDFIAGRRNFYFDALGKAFGQAAILNLIEKGSGDKFIEGTEEMIKDIDEFENDAYIAEINKAVFSKPFKSKRELYDRLIKIVPSHVAGKISGHVPEKQDNVNWINPATGETISAPANQPPGVGFRRVDKTLDRKTSAGSGTGQERVLAEAAKMAATNYASAVEYLAMHLAYKDRELGMKGARSEAEKMLEAYKGGGKSSGGSAPKTREEYEAEVRKKHPNASEEDIKATVEAKYGG